MVHASTMVIGMVFMLILGTVTGFIMTAVISAERRNEELKEAYLTGKRDALREQIQESTRLGANLEDLAQKIEQDIRLVRNEDIKQSITDYEELTERIIKNAEN